MFKNQVEPRTIGEWFHCQILNILWRHVIVYNSTDHRKLPPICFYDNMEKIRTELALVSLEKARTRYL